MIDAGLPLVQCLEILAGQQENRNVSENPKWRARIGRRRGDALCFDKAIREGLRSALLQHGRGWRDGRYSGHHSSEAFDVHREERQTEARGQVGDDLPSIGAGHRGDGDNTLALEGGADFRYLFNGLDVDLPLPTRIVIGLSNFVGSIYGLMLVIFFIAAGFAVKFWYGTPKGRFIIDGLILKAPVVGLVLRKIAVARFTRTLGTLISSGVPILEGLDITARTSGNAVIERAIAQTRKAVEAGRSLVDPLKETNVFPGMVTQMIGVGEQTGAMDAMLQKIADFYEDEVDAAVKDLLTAIEPIMIVFLGVVVGGVVISMYLPLFSLINKLSGH